MIMLDFLLIIYVNFKNICDIHSRKIEINESAYKTKFFFSLIEFLNSVSFFVTQEVY